MVLVTMKYFPNVSLEVDKYNENLWGVSIVLLKALDLYLICPRISIQGEDHGGEITWLLFCLFASFSSASYFKCDSSGLWYL